MKVSMVKVLGSSEPVSPAPEEGAGAEEATGVEEAADEATGVVSSSATVGLATDEAVGVAGAVPLVGVEGAGEEEPEPAGQRAGPGML
jgi:hypothetical protein